MVDNKFTKCFNREQFILTEGAVGLRLAHEFGIDPDEYVNYASTIYNTKGRNALRTIYRQYLDIAQEFDLPMILLTNTRRANRERVQKSKYKDLPINKDYSEFLKDIAAEYTCEVYVGGMMGCCKDAYTGEGALSTAEAAKFHSWQVNEFADSPVDFIFAAIMPEVNEIIGLSKAISLTDMPYIISLMVEEDGSIVDGHTIHDTIHIVDSALMEKPLCYMANCIHPRILTNALQRNNTKLVRERFRGIQANAAYLKKEVLDRSIEVKSSISIDLLQDIRALHEHFPLKIYGGCCGTDHSHIREIGNYVSRLLIL